MNNSKIHYRYAISYLVFGIILLLALSYYDVPELVDKLLFALTLSSLLLAILAIFYTIISAHKQDSHFSKLIETNFDLKASVKKIKTVSDHIDTTLNDFPSHFKKIGLKIDDLAEKYPTLSPEDMPPKDKKEDEPMETALNIDEALFYEIVGDLQFLSMAVLYLFSQAKFKDKTIDYLSFDDFDISSFDYTIGFLNGFKSTGLIDYKFHENAIIPIKCDKIVTENLKFTLEQIIKVMAKEHAELLKSRIENIDKLLS